MSGIGYIEPYQVFSKVLVNKTLAGIGFADLMPGIGYVDHRRSKVDLFYQSVKP